MNINTQQCLAQAKQAEQQNQWLEAIECYKKALEESPDYQMAKEGLAWCYSRAKEYNLALSILQDLMKCQPKVAKWPYMIGYQYQEMKKWREAIEWYDRALSLNPDYIVVLYRKGYSHSQLIQVDGVLQMRKALKAFEDCRKLWHDLQEGQQKQQDKGNCAKAAYHQAKVLLDNPNKLSPGTIESTIPLLKEAIRLDPKDHNKHYLLGKAFMVLGQSEQAIHALQEADLLEPNKEYILRELGNLYYRKGNYSQAEEKLQRAVRKDSRNHNGHYYLGLCYRDTGKLHLAVKELQEAIRRRQQHYHKPFPEAQETLDELLTQHSELTIESPKTGRQRGTIIKYVEDRGFGFIQSDAGGQVYFHFKDCRSNQHLERGVRVEFEEGSNNKGIIAIRVARISNDKNR